MVACGDAQDSGSVVRASQVEMDLQEEEVSE